MSELLDAAAQRTERERNAYDAGRVERDAYNRALRHANAGPAMRRIKTALTRAMRRTKDADVLELGSRSFRYNIDFDNSAPRSLSCINISGAEIDLGKEMARRKGIAFEPRFCLMDAQRLAFHDASFDLVFGDGILHHLDYPMALQEIRRVLRPDGHAVFFEPLALNPVGMAVRALTPHARTADERPLGLAELRVFKRYFRPQMTFCSLFSVPIGLASGLVFRAPDNVLTTAADTFDDWLQRAVPGVGPFYRYVILAGTKRD